MADLKELPLSALIRALVIPGAISPHDAAAEIDRGWPRVAPAQEPFDHAKLKVGDVCEALIGDVWQRATVVECPPSAAYYASDRVWVLGKLRRSPCWMSDPSNSLRPLPSAPVDVEALKRELAEAKRERDAAIAERDGARKSRDHETANADRYAGEVLTLKARAEKAERERDAATAKAQKLSNVSTIGGARMVVDRTMAALGLDPYGDTGWAEDAGAIVGAIEKLKGAVSFADRIMTALGFDASERHSFGEDASHAEEAIARLRSEAGSEVVSVINARPVVLTIHARPMTREPHRNDRHLIDRGDLVDAIEALASEEGS